MSLSIDLIPRPLQISHGKLLAQKRRGSCGIQNALGGDELTSPVLKKVPT